MEEVIEHWDPESALVVHHPNPLLDVDTSSDNSSDSDVIVSASCKIIGAETMTFAVRNVIRVGIYINKWRFTANFS